jgi:glycerophosphodiester phosphodiesterase
VRRNSLEEAVKLCLAGGLQGIVSEARGIFRHPAAVPKIKEANLSLLTYGTLK